MDKTQNAPKTQKPVSKKNIIAVIALCIVAAVALTAYYFLVPRGIEGSKTIHLEITADGTTTAMELKTNAAYLREALEETSLVEGEETVFGLWVQTVNGRTANDDEQEWWSLFVNEDFAMLGPDEMPVEDGDRFEYRLMVGYDDW